MGQILMTSLSGSQPPHDPVKVSLTPADDHVRLDHWLPQQTCVVPRIRIGQRWVNVLWVIPIVFVVLVLGVAIAQALRGLPAVQDFVARYPGVPGSVQPVTLGFPIWLRLQHFLNLFFMAFIIRSGVQIFADHSRLYWKRDCTPGTDSRFGAKKHSPASYEGRIVDDRYLDRLACLQ
jgi:methionine sulfoxide reductase catalytic subunit